MQSVRDVICTYSFILNLLHFSMVKLRLSSVFMNCFKASTHPLLHHRFHKTHGEITVRQKGPHFLIYLKGYLLTILFFLHDCTGIKTLDFLPFNQFRKETSCFTQRLVGTIFNNAPFIQNDNPITFFDCGQSMCDHNSCTF